ncbi:copper resistance CopC family protein [Leucobacter triazinivorans]|uniref:Copper resistance protein CopC n=1 Tax=Leucobacter triazinivorans TaxID=1784719 RepID=A0A4P6KCE2_9MICO|nr:copper resistance CopC family protein [Leucobacter triazinivorans]QBE47842.1 copper resistance protein CopC [Leucobacter triazinivorans]
MSRTRTTRPPLARPAAAALLVGAAAFAAFPALGTAAPAYAHDQLVDTVLELDPADGSAEAVRLTFSNSIIEVGTEVVVTAPDGSDATDGEPLVEGPEVTQALQSDLTPGAYSGAWRVVSSDGHPIEGMFTLTVPERGEPTIGDAEAPAEADGAESAASEDGHEHADDGHEHAESTDATTEEAAGDTGSPEQSGAPVGAVIAVIVGGAAVIAGGITAATVGHRRRAKGMAAAADPQGETSNEDREGRA